MDEMNFGTLLFLQDAGAPVSGLAVLPAPGGFTC